MTEILNEVWGELYWNTADWLPWLALQAILPAALAGVLQWWFSIRWPLVFLTTYAVALTLNISRLPPSAIPPSDLAKMNESLPREFDGITLEKISFNHRLLGFHASSPDPLEAGDIKENFSANSELMAEQCKMFGKWLATRQIKQIRFIYTWPGGTYSQSIEDRDCAGPPV